MLPLARTLLAFFLPFFLIAPAAAQQAPGTLRGTVHARGGEAVAGASVNARNAGTGQVYTTRSNVQGQFELPGLAPGVYEVEVAREGFVTQRRSAVELRGSEPLTLDFVLEPAAASQGGTPSGRISELQLAGLPLNGRSYNQLATLQAGVADTAGEQSSRGVGGGSLTVAGGRPTSNNFLLDGTNIMDTGNRVPRSAAGVQLGADSVFQVQVFSANSGAEYGRGSGGTLNSITLSGGSQFHGTLFEYFRNNKLDAPNYFDRDPLKAGFRTDPPPFKRNQFGFTLTGPVRRERTFFMGSFEALRDRLTTTDFTFLPDAQARLGFPDANGIPAVPVHPKVEPYLALYPMPNLGSIGGGIGRHAAPVFLPTDENFFAVRVDHAVSERDSFFTRYTFDDASGTDAQSLFLFRTFTQSRQQYLTLVETHIFSLRTLNSLRLGYTRPVNAIESLSSLEIPQSLYFVRGAPQFGQIEIPGLPTFGPQFTTPEANVMNSFQFADDVVAQRGAHTLKFGFEAHRYRWDVSNGALKSAIWSFNSLLSFLRAGPDGTVLDVTLPGSDNRKGFRQTLAGFYAQDGYRVSPRLELTLGLRYEFTTIISEKNGRLVYLPDPLRDTEIRIGPMLPENPSLRNFSPRLGFRWSPGRDRNTVLAGGFGVYYDPLLEYVVDLTKNSAPFYKRAVAPNFDASGTFPDAAAAAALIPFGTPFTVETLDYHHMRTPSVLRYNASLQQSLPGGWRAEASYVGARGNHLYRGYETNLFPFPVERADGSLFLPPNSGPMNPAFGPIAVVSSDAQSFYNSLQLSAAKVAGQSFSLQANYSYSKSVDDSSNTNTGPGASPGRQYPLRRTLDRGLSDFDLRHRLAVNYLFTLPVGRGKRWLKSGVLSEILGGWRLGGIVLFRSGTPFHPLVNVRTPGFLFAANRPNLRPGRSNNPTSGVSAGCRGFEFAAGRVLGGPELYFDPCSFGNETPHPLVGDAPEPGTLGNTGRNTILGPSVFSLDLSLQKEFLLGGERRLQFRAEFFNLPNHPNFASPPRSSAVLFSGSSGRSNGQTAGQIVRSITTARQIQFALRFSF
ncbi:MAG: TonB dep Rec protein [Acidobacteria bacterium]|nr:TonB dep Rec protein [Acidobacteriota bacterium]